MFKKALAIYTCFRLQRHINKRLEKLRHSYVTNGRSVQDAMEDGNLEKARIYNQHQINDELRIDELTDILKILKR